ncbi:MAG: bifunctional diaminohydroxyphosphoribosylaminopyrimidine deaminase/5-amino-6-(5-phosphoribosylamino)uracil reductase RibD [Thermoguttaceae bacterium]|nr:bifunctional diaminohydroxyphosphoribosylaminopyrimidine deaminase/5-amino-6-(5-phosphoribosylamino)uracil reductase RibD [Thermoguttaceae bacterium]
MRRALELAVRGQGLVEPNPMVGCVIARGAEILGEGWHGRYGGPHAEVEALRIAGPRTAGATMYVTLEPCCHCGKTPPCTEAVIGAAPARVVVAQLDPFPEVAGKGVAQLKAAGIAVEVGTCETEARRLNAPYLKLLETGRPWVLAKWAMTLDGKLATRTGESRWISGPESRAVVHRLRGRVDAVIVGRGTADRDDPLLTARPPGPRKATRVVLDTGASLALDSQLVRTAAEVPVLVAAGESAPPANRQRLAEFGCEVLVLPGKDDARRLDALLAELGRRRMTNVLFEGGARVLGTLLDARAIDEVHVFIAPKLLGGADAPSPVAGAGLAAMADALLLSPPGIEILAEDVYVHGRLSLHGARE